MAHIAGAGPAERGRRQPAVSPVGDPGATTPPPILPTPNAHSVVSPVSFRPNRFPESSAARSRASALVGVLIAAALPTAVSAAPRLRCQLEQGGETQVREFVPVTDPYGVTSVDIRDNFRFKAVVIGDAQHVEYIKLYTYYVAERRPVLLHEVRFDAPVAQAAPAPSALTGRHFIYSPRLEREFRYGCALFEVMP